MHFQHTTLMWVKAINKSNEDSPFIFIYLQQVHEITTLSVADMGPPLPMGLLLPLTNLKSLNLSGNHMDNVSLFILTPISTLQVGTGINSSY